MGYVFYSLSMCGFVSSIRKNAFGTSKFVCDALVFPSKHVAVFVGGLLETWFPDGNFVISEILI